MLQKLVPSPSLVPPPVLLTGKPFPSTSPLAGGTPINATATVNTNSYSVTGLDLSSTDGSTLHHR